MKIIALTISGAVALGGALITAVVSTPVWVTLAVAIVPVILGAIGWLILRTYARIKGYFQRMNQRERRLHELEESVYGNEKDNLQQGAIAEIEDLKEEVEDLERIIDRFLRE